MKKLTLRDVSVANRRVLVRVDFNVPLKDGRVGDDTRIRASLPTILRLKEQGARTILMSHLGRPKKGPDPSLSLAPVAVRLSELLGSPVAFAADCVGPPAETAAGKLHAGEILLLENLRFHPEEEANDPAFARPARLSRRLLCERCVRLRAPCPCIDGGRHALPFPVRRGVPHGEGARVAR